MSKKSKNKGEKKEDAGNIYDRIFRENARTIFIPLIQFQLNIDIINITAIDPNQLISTQIPEMVIMALLGNFKKDQLEKILHDIVERLKTLVGSKDLMSKYINQLLILARIRNLQMIISQKLDDMPISYNVEKDGLYLRGVEKGVKKGVEKGVARSAWKMFKAGNTIEIIAKTLELTIQQVEQYIKECEAKS